MLRPEDKCDNYKVLGSLLDGTKIFYGDYTLSLPGASPVCGWQDHTMCQTQDHHMPGTSPSSNQQVRINIIANNVTMIYFVLFQFTHF